MKKQKRPTRQGRPRSIESARKKDRHKKSTAHPSDVVIISVKNCTYPLPDGSTITIKPGVYENDDAVKIVVNKELERNKRPFFFNENGDLVPDMTPLPEFVQIYAGIKTIVDHAHKNQDHAAWRIGDQIFRDYCTVTGQRRWGTFSDFVKMHFPNAMIPASVRSGLWLPN